ncbi:MAG: hypothetical protein NVS3B17_07780 [Vulcanimicrobiaceae bacterium]
MTQAQAAAPSLLPVNAKDPAAAKPHARAVPKLSANAHAARAAAKDGARLAAVKRLAPGDEYCGPLKQSIIGFRNTLRDLGLRYDVNHDIASQTFASAQLTERSIRDWERKYPGDTQLPRAVYLLQRLYTKVLMQESRDRARQTAQWLEHDFARTAQDKQLRKTLAMEHLEPLPPPTASPIPAGSYPSEFGPAYPSEFSPSSPASATAPATRRPAPGAATPTASASPALPGGSPSPTPALSTPSPAASSPASSPSPHR